MIRVVPGRRLASRSDEKAVKIERSDKTSFQQAIRQVHHTEAEQPTDCLKENRIMSNDKRKGGQFIQPSSNALNF